MSKSHETLPESEEFDSLQDFKDGRSSSLKYSISHRQLSRSATELRSKKLNSSNKNDFRTSDQENSTLSNSLDHKNSGQNITSRVISRLHLGSRQSSVAYRTQTIFAALKSRWFQGRSKEQKKLNEFNLNLEDKNSDNELEYDNLANNSSDQSLCSSTTHSPAKHTFIQRASPLSKIRYRKDVSLSFENHKSKKITPRNFHEVFPDTAQVSFSATEHDVESRKSINCQIDKLEENNVPNICNTLLSEDLRLRENKLRQYAFFKLRLHLRRGTNLVAMDRCGASDPYIKIKSSSRLLYKSRIIHRDLNPIWDESVTLPIEDPFQRLNFKIFDYDWGLQDDFMGAAQLDLIQLELGQQQDIILELKDSARPFINLGQLHISATLWPKNQQEREQYFQKSSRLADVNRKLKSQIWSSVVTIVLVEAKNLLPMDVDGLSDPYVKFRLGCEKYKSKVLNKTLNPVWIEQFDFHLYEDPYIGQDLEVSVWDRDRNHQDDLIGRTIINLATLERETTHRLWCQLEDGVGKVFLLLTISGTTASETISDLTVQGESQSEKAQILSTYSMSNTLTRLRDVGHLTVKVYRAQGLVAADIGGKSDPFCVLELINSRLQTQTEYKTLAPNWQKIFTFNVKDINSILEVTVFDEDRDHKVEFLGKVAIPLLSIRNGDKRWYSLKDKKLRCRAKGNGPQILLELTVVWNIFRACVRTLNPKEKKYMDPIVKFNRQLFLRNVIRLKAIIITFIDLSKYVKSCWEWENKIRSSIALIFFIMVVYYFEVYMIPTVALLILLKHYIVTVLTGTSFSHQILMQPQDYNEPFLDDSLLTAGEDDEEEDEKDKEEKKSLKERLQAIQDVTQMVQNSIGFIASLCEKMKNLFNFTVPFLSYLAILLILLSIMVLYMIPVRYIILIWGINKFARKIIRPHAIANNELLDLISRVPDDEELLNYRELKLITTSDCESLTGRISNKTYLSSGSITSRRELRKRQKTNMLP